MVRAEITRELGTGRDGKRRFIYFVAIQGTGDGERYESPRTARKAAAERLQLFSHSAEIVEMWSDGKVYKATRGGKPLLLKGEPKVKDEATQVCVTCGQIEPQTHCNGLGECRICFAQRIAYQRQASGLDADDGPEAEAAMDAAVRSFPPTFGLRRMRGMYKISREDCYVNGGSIQLVIFGLELDGSWRQVAKATINELQKQIVRIQRP